MMVCGTKCDVYKQVTDENRALKDTDNETAGCTKHERSPEPTFRVLRVFRGQ